MRVLSLDPGEKVGWARADIDPDGKWTDVRHGITPLRDMAIAVHESMTRFPVLAPGEPLTKYASDYDNVVIEDWSLFPGEINKFAGSRFPAVQFIGAVKCCCWVSGVPLTVYQPAQKEPTLKAMAKLDPELHELVTRSIAHDDGHDQDALIHLFRYTWLNYDLEVPA
jgi:hypothetical protein